MLLKKSLKIVDLLQIEFTPICRLKVFWLISECAFMILAEFTQKIKSGLKWPLFDILLESLLRVIWVAGAVFGEIIVHKWNLKVT